MSQSPNRRLLSLNGYSGVRLDGRHHSFERGKQKSILNGGSKKVSRLPRVLAWFWSSRITRPPSLPLHRPGSSKWSRASPPGRANPRPRGSAYWG